jgi:aspartyl-tRNA(Asn)/glutamyl-tRNA(Gln) amidotransferase subunit C
MTINDEVLNKLEKLSMLKIQDDKREEIKAQLESIVGFVDNLSELDESLEDISFPQIDKSLRLRSDIAAQNRQVIDDILRNAPSSEDGFFVVPKIIE